MNPEYFIIQIGDRRPLTLKPVIASSKRNVFLGKKFHRLIIVEFLGSDCLGRIFCLCKCDCGKSISVQFANVKNGSSKSCGCQKSDATIARNKRNAHPHCKTRLYRIWKRMHQRCYDLKCDDFKDYGAKGVLICKEWHNYYNFYYWAIAHGYLDSLSIDRLDVTGIYEPSNCRWATPLEQGRNKRNNHLITFQGHTKTLSEWCFIFKMEPSKVRYRLSKNWPIEKVFINQNRIYESKRNIAI